VDVAVALAPAMAQLAAEHADQADLVALRACVRRLEDDLRGRDAAAFMRDNQQFHDLLATSTGNGLFSTLFGALQNIISGGHTGVVYSLAQMKLTLGTHSAVLDAVEAHDGPRARAEMRDHIEAWRRMLDRQHAEALGRPVRWGDS
jgi:GntR family transcriptional repressor for pyruvate dehydrogenase complex